MLRAERIEPTIRARVWSISPPPSEQLWTGALLQSGSAIIEDANDAFSLTPVSIFLAPADRERVFRIQAGSEAVMFIFPEQLVLTAIGRGPDSSEIRRMLNRPMVSQLLDQGRMAEQAERAFNNILEETANEAPGRMTMIEANLKLIFGTFLRNLPDTEMSAPTFDRGSSLLLRFRQLLEHRFRDRWSIRTYASELGISADRLHDLCTSKLGKAPSTLVRGRTIYEAQILLSQSSLSIKEIAATLGFRDPAHFSKFFKAAHGKSPLGYRQTLAQSLQEKEAPELDFADWP